MIPYLNQFPTGKHIHSRLNFVYLTLELQKMRCSIYTSWNKLPAETQQQLHHFTQTAQLKKPLWNRLSHAWHQVKLTFGLEWNQQIESYWAYQLEYRGLIEDIISLTQEADCAWQTDLAHAYQSIQHIAFKGAF